MRENRQQCVGWHVNNNVIKTKYRYFVSSNNLQKKTTLDDRQIIKSFTILFSKKKPPPHCKKTLKNH